MPQGDQVKNGKAFEFAIAMEFPDERIFYYVTCLGELCDLLGKHRSREDFYVSRIYGFY